MGGAKAAEGTEMQDSVFEQDMNNVAFRSLMERTKSSNAGQEKYARR